MSYVGEFANISTTIWNFLQSTDNQKIIVVTTTIHGNTVGYINSDLLVQISPQWWGNTDKGYQC